MTHLVVFVESRKPSLKVGYITEGSVIRKGMEESDLMDPVIETESKRCAGEGNINTNSVSGCAVRQRLVIYTAETLHLVVFVASLAGLVLGFTAGYLVSRRFHSPPPYPDVPFIEQHNHLER